MDANKYLTELAEREKEWKSRLAEIYRKAEAMSESLPEGDFKDEMRKILDNAEKREERG